MRLTRNIMNHFSKAGVTKNISRTAFKMPFHHTTTFSSGRLIPFFMQECVPGDSVQVNSTAMLARMQTPLVPVMGTAILDYWYFFVPTRLVWDNFKEFMGENTHGAWDTNLPDHRIPVVDTRNTPVTVSSSAAYLGLPVGSYGTISAIPFRSIRQVWNDWFRSTALQDPLLINKGDTEPNYIVGPKNFDLLPVCKFADYFTTALPSPQYGDPVSIGLAGLAPVQTMTQRMDEQMMANQKGLIWASLGLYDDIVGNSYPLSAVADGNVNSSATTYQVATIANAPTATMDHYTFFPVNQWVDLSSVGAVTINDLRIAFQIQKYKETQARGGSRYTEILESIWSVTSPDARLQRSEYIGGDRTVIGMQQVLQTSATTLDSTPQGNASGFSKTVTKGGGFTYAVPEHGLVLGFCSVRPVHSYQQGVDRYWKKRDVMDFYNPLLANIGETPVYQYEIFATANNSDQDDPNVPVFGYQEAWADYRWKRDYVSGEMLSASDNSLDIYHYADDYNTAPTLSNGWISEDPKLIDRTLAVSSGVSDQFRCDIFVDLNMIRPMPAYSIPGLIDHA